MKELLSAAEKREKIATLFLVGLTLSSFAFAFWYLVSGWTIARDIPDTKQISVSGEGKVAVRPDIAVFSAGVVTQKNSVKEAQDENSRSSNRILDFLKKSGIEDNKDVRTAGYNVYPQYEQIRCFSFPCPSQSPRISFYEVRHTIEVKVRNLDSVDELLDGVAELGANEIGSVQFQVDDEEGVKREARKKAIEDAEEKARMLAKDLGVRLGDIVGFSESGGGFPIFARAALEGGFGGDRPLPAPAPKIAPGEQEIRSQVTITYEFR